MKRGDLTIDSPDSGSNDVGQSVFGRHTLTKPFTTVVYK